MNPDLFLNSLIKYINTAPVEMNIKLGITLCVQGSIITGLLISEKAYFEGLSNEINAFHPFKEDFERLLAPFQVLGTSLPGNQGEQNKLTDIEFIHLKNAKFFLGTSLVPNNKGTYWRGRLSRVDGFSLGQLSSNN